MDDSQILRFKQMFNYPEDNSFSSPSTTKNITHIVEYTINCPRNVKRFKDKSSEDQMHIYEGIISHISEQMKECLEDELHYFEKCRDGTVHVHGRYNVKPGLFFIEGIIQDFVKNALKKIDGRLKYSTGAYFHYMNRYRSPTMCVQYTDDVERILHWDQYIRKNA